jgi:acyl-CoA synthetase (AMP-forming)/AMP-acid ligase II
VAAIRQHDTTTAFGSPAIWRRVAPYCLGHGIRLSGLKRLLIAGASVPPALIRDLHAILDPDGDVATPYGATEALPVASLTGREIVEETAARTREGAGTCVGRPAPGIEVAIIPISDEPIARWQQVEPCADGEIGELCVKGAVVTRAYDGLPEATRLAKIRDGDAVWHRMGDLGYRDADGRLWFCGRKSERLRTPAGPVFTDTIEGIFSAHPRVGRTALVGVGEPDRERPVLIVEGAEDLELARELKPLAPIDAVLFHPRLPVDVRHNAKIHRPTLKAWAERKLGVRS